MDTELEEKMFNVDDFINKYVIKRSESMFNQDINNAEIKLISKIKNKSVLVIGGAGSIGSAFIKSIIPYEPASIVVVDINENALTELTRDLRSTRELCLPKEFITYPMDFASLVFEKMFRGHNGFDIVANFSAHKHVRSEKDIYSVEAMIRNNLLHAKKLLDILEEFPPEEYFCVSTDKAANPVNLMGASKRVMEDLIFSYSDKFPVKTARFANVAFSNGSLPAGFLQRIAKLQPISAPCDVRRYFVSPKESGQICMLACMMGENREIFFPKLIEGQMMTFDAIASNLLLEHGYKVLECNSDEEALEKAEDLKKGSKLYPVHFEISDTSGEKPYEEFYTDKETRDMERFHALGVITDKDICDCDKLNQLLIDLNKVFDRTNADKAMVVNLFEDYLKDFKHIETGKSLDSKM